MSKLIETGIVGALKNKKFDWKINILKSKMKLWLGWRFYSRLRRPLCINTLFGPKQVTNTIYPTDMDNPLYTNKVVVVQILFRGCFNKFSTYFFGIDAAQLLSTGWKLTQVWLYCTLTNVRALWIINSCNLTGHLLSLWRGRAL